MKLVAVMLGLAVVGCATTSPQAPASVRDVSLIRLIGSPGEFRGQRVRVLGYLHMEFEGDAVYLHKEDYERRTFMNGLSVSAAAAMDRQLHQASDHYVLIEGTFDPDDTGHLGGWSGSIRDISRVAPWPPKLGRSETTEPNPPSPPTRSDHL